jgi:hypothetical protein
MMDDLFILQTAALHANLITLERNAEALTDLSDMQALRRYRADLEEFTRAHATAGRLPADPLRHIEPRLTRLEQFFTETREETSVLLNWAKDWLTQIPQVSFAELEEEAVKIRSLIDDLPEKARRLAELLDERDWQTEGAKPDLRPELRLCHAVTSWNALPKPTPADEIERLGGIRLPAEYRPTPEKPVLPVHPEVIPRNAWDYREYAQCTGRIWTKILNHLNEVLSRIEELKELHAQHQATVETVKSCLANNQIHSAKTLLAEFKGPFFSDLGVEGCKKDLKQQL